MSEMELRVSRPLLLPPIDLKIVDSYFFIRVFCHNPFISSFKHTRQMHRPVLSTQIIISFVGPSPFLVKVRGSHKAMCTVLREDEPEGWVGFLWIEAVSTHKIFFFDLSFYFFFRFWAVTHSLSLPAFLPSLPNRFFLCGCKSFKALSCGHCCQLIHTSFISSSYSSFFLQMLASHTLSHEPVLWNFELYQRPEHIILHKSFQITFLPIFVTQHTTHIEENLFSPSDRFSCCLARTHSLLTIVFTPRVEQTVILVIQNWEEIYEYACMYLYCVPGVYVLWCIWQHAHIHVCVYVCSLQRHLRGELKGKRRGERKCKHSIDIEKKEEKAIVR